MPPFESDSYTAVFGGQNRSPAQIDYVFYQISKDIHTQWPFLAADGAYIAPAKLDISASISIFRFSCRMPRSRRWGLPCAQPGGQSFHGRRLRRQHDHPAWRIWSGFDDSRSMV
jgi:hypothetical protein